MNKTKIIRSIYKTLLIYEDVQNDESEVLLKDYYNYLNRVYVLLIAVNKEVAQYFKGLIDLGAEATHDNVKSTVFHVIKVIDKGVN